MKLKDYIKEVLKAHLPGEDVEFVVNLDGNGNVSSTTTGNTIKFTICVNGDERYEA